MDFRFLIVHLILDCKTLINIDITSLEVKYFLFAYLILNSHQAGHQPQKSDKLPEQVLDGWLVVQWMMNECQRNIAQKIF